VLRLSFGARKGFGKTLYNLLQGVGNFGFKQNHNANEGGFGTTKLVTETK